MRYFPAFIILIHGCIHCMGFAKAFGYGNITALTKYISKAAGSFWLLAAFLFITAAILLLLKKEHWFYWALPAAIISQALIISEWKDAKFGTIVNILVLAAIITGFAAKHFSNRYKKDVTAYLKNSGMFHPALLSEDDIKTLPEPVKKYIRYTQSIGQPKIKNFRVEFTGGIRKKGQQDFMPFQSDQYNFTGAATRLFFMNAKMMRLPVAGYHCYKNGQAFMDIRLLSLFRVQYQSGNEMNMAETVTFFNDMCCMAPATLMDERIQWLGTKEDSVTAAFTVNNITIRATLVFGKEGQLVNFISNDRFAQMDDGSMQRLTWSTPLKDYKEINGYRLPGYAAAVYTYPDGDFTYGTFSLQHIMYNIQPK
ncbi:MAG: DUF6544 family protein [Ferruginibacter sp.]